MPGQPSVNGQGRGMNAQLLQIQDSFEAELRDASSPVGLGESSLLGTFLLLNFLLSVLLPLPLYWLPPGSTTYLKQVPIAALGSLLRTPTYLRGLEQAHLLRSASTLASVSSSNFSC